MNTKVITIPATKSYHTSAPLGEVKRKKVAAYARVSTDHEEQLNSFEAQLDYYTRYINSHEDWEMVKVYSDEGISGTSIKYRKGFNEMMDDALAGKIDLILTKSVSRFARNTVDSLTAVRTLKEHGVEIFFEKENIRTLDSKGELLITIMSSLAQDESRNTSENSTWGIRKRFQDGKLIMPFSSFLGYDRGPDGSPVINEKQAAVVRRIYSEYLKGYTLHDIAVGLTRDGIKTPKGCDNWTNNGILRILTNEKYTGDSILQKRYTTDFLTKTTKVNEGEVPQYYVENSHPAIIDKVVYELVQNEMSRRRSQGAHLKGKHIFSSKIRCADCGDFYGRKVFHSTDKYKCHRWYCNSKYENGCNTPTITDEMVETAFIKSVNCLIKARVNILEDISVLLDVVLDTEMLYKERDALNLRLEQIVLQADSMLQVNATVLQNQETFRREYDNLICKAGGIKAEIRDIENRIDDIRTRRSEIEKFRDHLAVCREQIEEFRPELWITLVQEARVSSDGDITILYKDGSEY